MEGFAAFVGISYLVGMIVSTSVIRARAGVGVWGRLQIFGDKGFGPVWFMSALLACLGWPITLLIWLMRGRPEPRVVFNEKAEERARRLAEERSRIGNG